MLAQEEQQKLLTTHLSTYHFVKQYFLVYNIQSQLPFKIFLSQLQCPEKLSLNFFHELYTIIETDKHPFITLKLYDSLFAKIQQYKYVDREAFEILKRSYIKAIKYYLANMNAQIIKFYHFI